MMHRREGGRVVKYVFKCDADACPAESPELSQPTHPAGWCVVRISTFQPGEHCLEVGFDLCASHADRVLELVGPKKYAEAHARVGARR
jgi:hypothetical protein